MPEIPCRQFILVAEALLNEVLSFRAWGPMSCRIGVVLMDVDGAGHISHRERPSNSVSFEKDRQKAYSLQASVAVDAASSGVSIFVECARELCHKQLRCLSSISSSSAKEDV